MSNIDCWLFIIQFKKNSGWSVDQFILENNEKAISQHSNFLFPYSLQWKINPIVSFERS